MVAKRTLPDRRNPLISPEASPPHELLVERRRLGQTNLAVKPGIAGLSNGNKGQFSGTFDYAHLRVPLPKDLAGSGIFQLKTHTSYPEFYFLMRRSSDGFISATGMFKAAFPWASMSEEEAERRFQKTFPSAGMEEVAGSVWIAPEEALQLSEEYGMRGWIMALLDPTPIERGAKDRPNSHIQMPPRFDLESVAAPVLLPPTSALRNTRARSSRSASPSKMTNPGRKIASPRKSRTTRSALKPEVVASEEVVETVATASATSALQSVETGTLSEFLAPESVSGEVKEPETETKEEAVHIQVEETVEQDGELETTTTKVKIDVPVDHPELREPEDPTAMIAEATRMVQEASKELDGATEDPSSRPSKSKRKAEELVEDNEVEIDERPAKQARTETLDQKVIKEKVTVKALFALGLTVTLGAAVQYFT